MGRPAKCRICGAKLDTATAYKIVVNGKAAYYCSKAEHDADEAKKKKAEDDKDKVYRLICAIIGREKIINTALWKEWKVWNEVASDEVIAQYLDANKGYLMGTIARLDDVEYNRIRYLSAVLKNKLGDYKPKVKEETKVVQVDETLYDNIQTRQNKRRSLADLEDEY